MKIEKELLYKFIEYYYSNSDLNIQSTRELSKMFDSSRTRITTVLRYFVESNYLVSEIGDFWTKNPEKLLHKQHYDFQIENDYYVCSNDRWFLKVRKYECDQLLIQYEIESVSRMTHFETMLFIMFEMHRKYKSSLLSRLKNVDGVIWYFRESYYRGANAPIFVSGYTQGKNELIVGR